MNKPILDACCGSRMFYFDRNEPHVLFVDKREVDYEAIWKSSKNNSVRYCSIHPDVIADFRALPFDDESFCHVIFDPPHLLHAGDTAWMVKKYGKLPVDWGKYLHDGFAECWRVLHPYGTLIFKWCEYDIPVKEVIAAIGREPLYGHRSGKQSRTHWMAFVKFPEEEI